MIDKNIPYVLGMKKINTYKLTWVTTPPTLQTFKFYGVTYSVKLPQMLWKIWMSGFNADSIVSVAQYFFLKRFPTPGTNKALYLPPFPNTFRNGGLCHPSRNSPIDISLVELVNFCIASFWDEPFNSDVAQLALRAWNAPTRYNASQDLAVAFGRWEEDPSCMPWMKCSYQSITRYQQTEQVEFQLTPLFDQRYKEPNFFGTDNYGNE